MDQEIGMSVRVAVLGAGIMGADHARILAQDVPGAAVQVICDMSLARAQEVGNATGALDVSDDPFATIRRADVDAVLIASPDQTHPAFVLASLAADKPILCEKPLAQTSAECLTLVEAEIARGRRLLQVGFMRRYDPSYASVKAVIERGQVGGSLMMHNFHRAVSAPPDFTGPMAITNAAPHEFDISRHVLQTDFKAITAFAPTAASEELRCGPVLLVLETTGGHLVTIEVHVNAVYGYDVKAEVVGEVGAVRLTQPMHDQISCQQTSSTAFHADWRTRFAEAYRLQNQDWVQSILNGQPPARAANAWDGYLAAVIAKCGVEALVTGARVPIPVTQRPPFYDQ